ncbi:BBIP1 protein, partial [Tricholaema leucomelas]|nr:BBIP1 protein [Tricholaema leucomelas]
MPEGKAAFREVLPKQGNSGRRERPGTGPAPPRSSHTVLFFFLAGQLSVEDKASMVLCKPKVLPLKSVTLEKLEKLQRAALEAAQPPDGAPASQPQP